jgi:hypothetical protein
MGRRGVSGLQQGRWWMGSEPWGFDLVVVAVKISNGKIATFASRIRSRNHQRRR